MPVVLIGLDTDPGADVCDEDGESELAVVSPNELLRCS
jgi:hypothetical protein